MTNDEPLGDPESDSGSDSAEGWTLQRVAYWVSLPLIALGLVLLLRLLVVTPYRIPSESMRPTLEIGDRVVVNRLSYTAGEIERGQVVVFERPPNLPGDEDVIKRVVGLPGETVRFDEDNVYIDRLRMVEPYLVEPASTRSPATIPGCDPATNRAWVCVVPDGHVFVLGDNREDSVDSRSYGPIPIDTIIGRASLRIWPLSDVNQL